MSALGRVAAIGVAATLVVVTPSTAWARHGGSDSASVKASCGTGTTALSLKARNGGLEAEYELDQNHNGQAWRVSMTRNGTVVAHAKRRTHGPSGSFVWRVTLPGAASTDSISVAARRGATTCTINSGGSSAGSGSSVDSIRVSKAYTNATATTGGELLIKADSTDPSATLMAYRPDGTLIGPVQNGGGSRYGGTVMPYQPNDPGTITIVSSSGGSITVPTGPFQL